MADQKISELTNITGANLADADEFVVVDVSADQTKAVTLGELKEAFDTGTGFVRITGDTMTGDLSFGDNDKAIFGSGSDLQVYHTGGGSYIDDTGAGNLLLKTNGNKIAFQNDNGGSPYDMFAVLTSGAIQLNHLSDLKLATTSTGIDVTGTVTADGLTVDGQGTFTTSDNNAQVTLISTDTDALVGPQLNLWRNSGTGTNGDLIGQITFTGEDTIGSTNTFASIYGVADQTNNGSEDGSIHFQTLINGVLADRLEINSEGNSVFTGTVSADGLTVSNTTGSLLKLESTGTGLGAGSVIGDIQFYGNDASTPGAGIKAGIKVETVASLGDDAQMKFTTSNGTTNNVDRMLIANNGDISFYEDTGTTPKFFWDASAESLKLGHATTSYGDNLLDLVGQGSGVRSGVAWMRSGTSDSVHQINVNGSKLEFGSGGALDTSPTMVLTTSGNVGIGASSPSYKFEVSDGTRTAVLNPNASLDGIFFGTKESKPLILGTGDNERMRITSSGSVGIGTSSPSAKLEVNGGGTATSGGTLVVRQDGDTNADGIALTSSNAISHRLWKDSGGKLNVGPSTLPSALVQDLSGNVGIGTTSPARALDVQAASGDADVRIYAQGTTSSDDAILYLGIAGTTATNRINFGDVNDADRGRIIYGHSSDYMSFTTAASEAARIDASGNLLVGKTVVDNTTQGARIYSTGRMSLVSQDDDCLILNRRASDGVIATFRKNGTTVGVIGVKDADPYIGKDAVGLTFDATGPDGIRPFNTATQVVRDNGIDLGGASSRFKDIYLSGKITNDGTGGIQIDTSGNVGIGTTSPSEKLSVEHAGDVSIEVKSTGTGDADADLILDAADTGEASVLFRQDGADKAYIQWFNEGSPDLNFVTVAGTDGVFDFQPNNVLAMRIDSSGNVLVGTNSVNVANQTGTAQGVRIAGPDNIQVASTGVAAYFNKLSTDGDIVEFRKSGSTVGSIGVVSSDNVFLSGNGSHSGIMIGTSAIVPFANGSTSDNSEDLGSNSSRWDDIFATNGTIQTSDRNEKQDIEALSDAEQRVAVACKGLLRKFRWIDSVAEKGDDARIHFGIIAQDLQDAFAAEGLDAGRYAMFISTTWWETQTEVPAVEAASEVLDEDGNVVTEAVEAKDAYTRTDTHETLEDAPEGATERTRLGVRYPELLAFIIAAI